ncbi:hypothetical protein PV08_00689 [Exophiala spinifera]|uniref:TauD/TfdA-like domain-containing protein n=1 Tax=Exophiala spinifera TaxID=91928 RepID=A0A0D2C972_9EURO|nr:uncharacterized protein PV08_00689 [Exophiala spinifera]KIW20114.1 hypothetical protein PV08_00689 [Exophiala spinifera]
MIAKTPVEILDPEVAALAAKYDVYEVHKALAARDVANAYPLAKYPEYLPSTEHGSNPGYHGEFDHIEPGTRADPAMPNLKGLPGYTEDCIRYITPRLGSIIKGVQLSKLTAAGLDELALLATQRGVLAFHDQDLKDQGIEKFKEFGNHFGPLHRHPTQSLVMAPRTRRLRSVTSHERKEAHSLTECRYVQWHTDQCHEPQPPAVSMLVALEVPATGGGDTLFCSATRAYDTLSPAMQKFVCTLWSENSSKLISDSSAKIGGPVRRAPVPIAHPVVRVHPTTGQRSLFHNPHFSTDRIHNLKEQENIAIGNFLRNHIENSQDFQCRVRWAEGAVVVYDQRVVFHSATHDYEPGDRRHLLRIT